MLGVGGRSRSLVSASQQGVFRVVGDCPTNSGDPLLPIRTTVVDDFGDDQRSWLGPVEGERPERHDRRSGPDRLIVAPDGSQGPAGPVEIRCGLESGTQGNGESRADAHQESIAGVEYDPGGSGQGVGVECRPRGKTTAYGRERHRTGHDWPRRVAVNNCLRPPERVRRLTDEKPAWLSTDRNSSVGGR